MVTLEEKIKILESKLGVHPCGGCIYYGEKCMENFLDCEYSEKEIIDSLSEIEYLVLKDKE